MQYEVVAEFMDPYRPFKEDGPVEYVKMATLVIEANSVNQALDIAFRHTNNVVDSWSRGTVDRHPSVQVHVPFPVVNGKTYGHRSASMGDRFRVDGKLFEIATFGFEEIEGESA